MNPAHQSPAHPPPSSPSRQSKAMSQKEYREKEQECFIMLRDIIKDLSGDEPRTRQETLRKAIEMLFLELGKQEEAEQECYNRLRDIIKDLIGNELRTRHEILEKAIEILSLELGTQKEAQCTPRNWQPSTDFDTATFYEGVPLHDQQYNMPDMDSAPNQPGFLNMVGTTGSIVRLE